MRKLANEELRRKSIEEFKNSRKMPVSLVLDNVRSMNNVGSAFRTADAFLVEKIWLGGITARPPHREITKTALGATESVDWEHVADTAGLIRKLQQDKYHVIAIEQATESIPLQEFVPEKGQKYALVFGNEVYGVTDEIVQAADTVIEIPQFGTKHSLNISVSIGIVVWDIVAKMGI